jgi:hypothetical protein
MTSTAFSAAVHPGEAFIDVAFDQPQAAEPTAAVCGTGHAWARIPREPAPDEREALKARVRELLKEKNAVLVSHYYVHPDLQDLAMKPAASCPTAWKWPASGATMPPRRWWCRA